MLGLLLAIVMILSTGLPAYARAAAHSKVDSDLRVYDVHIAVLERAFEKTPGDTSDKEWVRRKLAHMVEVDQYMRNYGNIPYEHSYTPAQLRQFQTEFASRWKAIDSKNTSDMRLLLGIYGWIKISQFGPEADRNAWLLVQHADQDLEFQKSILSVLEQLYPKGETSPSNYAYLFDRVAYSPNDPAKRRPQRYGTQGKCAGPGTWAPWTVEDPEHLNDRRKAMGLGTEAEYLKMFKEICHEAQ